MISTTKSWEANLHKRPERMTQHFFYDSTVHKLSLKEFAGLDWFYLNTVAILNCKKKTLEIYADIIENLNEGLLGFLISNKPASYCK